MTLPLRLFQRWARLEVLQHTETGITWTSASLNYCHDQTSPWDFTACLMEAPNKFKTVGLLLADEGYTWRINQRHPHWSI